MNLRVSYRNTVVTVSGSVAPETTAVVGYRETPGESDGLGLPIQGVVMINHGRPGAFESLLSRAHHVLGHFQMSQPGGQWGADGIGFVAQKASGNLEIHKSGVGPRKFREGLKAIQTCECRAEVTP